MLEDGARALRARRAINSINIHFATRHHDDDDDDDDKNKHEITD